MTSRLPGRTTFAALRRRLLPTAVLVLIALGAAGLAAAVDRPHGEAHRPELTLRVDRAAQPWLDGLVGELQHVEQAAAELSSAGRRVLIEAHGLDGATLESALAEGHAANGTVAEGIADLGQGRGAMPAEVEVWRLGATQRDLLSRIDESVSAGRSLDATWQAMAEKARLVEQLLSALSAHDEGVLEAVAAGREGRWAEAIVRLDQARDQLELATAAGQQLSAGGRSASFDDLRQRYAAYGDALRSLYALVEQTNSPDAPEALELRRQVEAAQVALPTASGTLRSIVSEIAGPALTDSLVEIEAARGVISAALEVGP